MSVPTVILNPDLSELEQALVHLAELPPEKLKLFFKLLNAGAELIRIELQVRPSGRTNEVFVCFRPSDLFLQFLSAYRMEKDK